MFKGQGDRPRMHLTGRASNGLQEGMQGQQRKVCGGERGEGWRYIAVRGGR